MCGLTKLVLIVVLLYNCVNACETNAASIQASSCSENDVQTEITSASDGDTVIIPSGRCSWANRIVINKSITIQGQTTTSRNASTYQVIATDNTNIQTSGFEIRSTGIVRITGITFDGLSKSVFSLPSSCSNLRIDHCHFKKCQRAWIKSDSAAGLLFDHNRITNPTNESYYITGNGNSAWSTGGPGGGSNPELMTWIENNEFIWDGTGGSGSPIDHGEGARVTWRYNKFTGHPNTNWGDAFFETHGHCWGQRDGNDNAGTYFLEVSNNKFDCGGGSEAKWKLRGGRFVFYNNTLTGTCWSTELIRFWVQEVTYNCNSTPCAVQHHEDTGLHAVPLSGAINYTNGLCDVYPCPMQPNNCYMWNNTSDETWTVDEDWHNNDGTYIDEYRDYWDDNGAGDTNFTTGVFASRPASPSDDDCYFATDIGVLYRSDGPGNWIKVYEAYTYPHPLSNSAIVPSPPESGSAPSPPQNLSILE